MPPGTISEVVGQCSAINEVQRRTPRGTHLTVLPPDSASLGARSTLASLTVRDPRAARTQGTEEKGEHSMSKKENAVVAIYGTHGDAENAVATRFSHAVSSLDPAAPRSCRTRCPAGVKTS